MLSDTLQWQRFGDPWSLMCAKVLQRAGPSLSVWSRHARNFGHPVQAVRGQLPHTLNLVGSTTAKYEPFFCVSAQRAAFPGGV